MKYLLLFAFIIGLMIGHAMYIRWRWKMLVVRFLTEYDRVMRSFKLFYNFANRETDVSEALIENSGISKSEFLEVQTSMKKIGLENIKKNAECLLEVYEDNFKELNIEELDYRAESLISILIEIRRWLLWHNE